jgi:hypothetical protein
VDGFRVYLVDLWVPLGFITHPTQGGGLGAVLLGVFSFLGAGLAGFSCPCIGSIQAKTQITINHFIAVEV